MRPAGPKDRAALLALNAELQAHEAAIRPSRRAPAEAAAAGAAPAAGAMFVAERDGALVGFVTCFTGEDRYETPAAEMQIRDLVVAEGARRQGVARALVEGVRAFARTQGLARITVIALAANEEAIAAYRALGFRPVLVALHAVV